MKACFCCAALAALVCASNAYGSQYTVVIDENQGVPEASVSANSAPTSATSLSALGGSAAARIRSASESPGLGVYNTKAEAWAYGTVLAADRGTSRVKVVELPEGSLPTDSQEPKIAFPFKLEDLTTQTKQSFDRLEDHLKRVGLTTTGNSLNSVAGKPVSSMTKTELSLVGYEGSNTSGILALEKLMTLDAGTTKSQAHKLRLARRVMKLDKNRSWQLLSSVEETTTGSERAVAKLYKAYWHNDNSSDTVAIKEFETVASDPGLPLGVRRDAMRTAAGIAHRRHLFSKAFLSFQQLADTAEDPDAKADAEVNLAGLAFEMVKSGNKATYEDVDLLCSKILEDPDAPRRHKATAAMMKMEVQLETGDTTGALTSAEDILTTYPDIKREWIACLVWKGRILHLLSRSAEATAAFQQVLEQDIKAEDLFGNRQPKADALRWLVFLKKSQGDLSSAQTYFQQLLQQFPSSPETTEARAIMGQQVNAPGSRR